jgi:hypothetical protein
VRGNLAAPMGFVFLFLFMSLPWIIIGFTVQAKRKRIAAFRAQLAHDSEVLLTEPPATLGFYASIVPPSIRTRRPPFVTVTYWPGGRNSPERWRCDCASPGFGRLSSLSLSKEGVLGVLRESLGVQDVHIGDADFDREFTVRGSNADVIKRVLSSPSVQYAIRTLFEEATDCQITGGTGDVCVYLRCRGLDAQTAKAHAHRVAALITALEAASV